MKPHIFTVVIFANLVWLAVAELFDKDDKLLVQQDDQREEVSNSGVKMVSNTPKLAPSPRLDDQREEVSSNNGTKMETNNNTLAPSPQLDNHREQAVMAAQETANETLSIDNLLLSGPVATFTQSLLDKILKNDEYRQSNVVLSPFSIHICLSMLLYASPQKSSTHLELAKALGLNVNDATNYQANFHQTLLYYNDISEKDGTSINLANKIFIGDGFIVKKNYQEIIKAFLTAVDNSVSFSNPPDAEKRINAYVSEKTNGLIDQLLPPESLDILTRMVLVNAIYFKANWLTPFEKSETFEGKFKLLGSTTDQPLTVTHEQMMFHPEINVRAAFNVTELNGADILELPYKHTDFNMYVGLPKENTLESLDRLAQDIEFTKFAKKLTGGDREVQMPGFDLKFDVELDKILQSMGINYIFDETKANFTDLTDENLAVTKAVHSAAVKVDESGSEAAAATAIIGGTRSDVLFIQNQIFIVDRPFVFMIHDKVHDVPLFFGRILNPTT